MRSSYEMATKYFKSEEGKETLTGKFNQDKQVEKRTFKYATGAVYSGEWLGGLRHGMGTMEWPDKARYEGMWQYNQACG